ncbi:MAG: glycosyl hydrolase [Candidatus Berkelbacteria bacterium]|nr:glycosyl hydrolase [Candidatus Berkelbacteria bacterium]
MKTFGKILVAIAVIVIVGCGIYVGWKRFFQTEADSQEAVEPSPTQTAKTVIPVTIPQANLANKFGFLSAGEGDSEAIINSGAMWVRPHPGPFLWDSMQKEKGGELSFELTDKVVSDYQKSGLAILATIWPFAEWDQISKSDAAKCAVSSEDEFLSQNDKKGRGEDDYLPEHRCNPNDWDAYQKWVSQVIERYDGDGTNDMPNLKIPIKYWEVMNEPDLDGNERLDFYKQDANAYIRLLTTTYQAIKGSDQSAQVLIAGAAGGNEQFLKFYRTVLRNKDAAAAFDIGNVHCISNDNYQSFNVEPYQKMLEGFNLNKPVWVTEAEAIISQDENVNATQTYESTKKALELKAQRIFFTRYSFESREDLKDRQTDASITPSLDGKDPIAAYKKITAL